jgi:UMF1 family MFS transporter
MTDPIKKGDKKTMRAWAFYDWANSVYPLVISTAIFPIFYEKTTAKAGLGLNHDEVLFFGSQIKNTVLYSYVIAASLLMVCFLSPLLSGIADYSGSKKKFMQFFCYLGAGSVAALYFWNDVPLEIAMTFLFLASLGFWNSLVFYNAYLPEVAEPKDHDSLSARGFSMGYIGSALLLIALLVAIQVFKMPAEHSFWITGLWWMGFAQITYKRLPAAPVKNKITGKIMGNGFRELKKVGAFVKKTKRLKRYLISFFIFSMGVQTVMLMAVLFAKKEVFKPDPITGDENTSGLIIAVLLIQFIAVPGSILFSKLSSKIGNLKTLGAALFIWVVCCCFAYFFVYDEINFYILAGIVGFVMGGTQALSRSTYSKFLPETKDTASFFSFYDITEKLGIVIGMVIFGYVEATSGDMRMSVLALVAFFIAGFIALFFVPAKENETIPEVKE